MKILVANVGSTSFKFKLYDMVDESILAQGKIENIGDDESSYQLISPTGEQKGKTKHENYESAIRDCIDFITSSEYNILNSLNELSAVGFKTVHGKNMRECRILDHNVLKAMEEYNFLAPAHNPQYINAIKIFKRLIPAIPAVGLFEHAFHKTIPDYAYTSGLPLELAEKHGIRKYGFHGASHRYISERAPEFAGFDPHNVRLISCHLGGSSSICAIENGKSIDTSMSFSPQSGLLNANRCGDLDPFIPLYLQKVENMTVDDVADLLQSRSGMAGIAGKAKDVKQIENDAYKGDKRAQLAVNTFCYRVKHYIGAYFVALGGCDLLVFTGGIGEKGAPFRKKITDGLGCIGIKIDEQLNKNVKGEAIISTKDSNVKVAVVPTNEELIVAREAQELLQ